MVWAESEQDAEDEAMNVCTEDYFADLFSCARVIDDPTHIPGDWADSTPYNATASSEYEDMTVEKYFNEMLADGKPTAAFDPNQEVLPL